MEAKPPNFEFQNQSNLLEQPAIARSIRENILTGFLFSLSTSSVFAHYKFPIFFTSSSIKLQNGSASYHLSAPLFTTAKLGFDHRTAVDWNLRVLAPPKLSISASGD
ncbi:unnamed protein product [Citrullus colocynthis]|uniref:Uncharacterized protein n=1 Tax=Citrullus colocynthis TaxID=252529 RepID=A0ABP0Y3M7_9ROSI